jgi:hypothetical protein
VERFAEATCSQQLVEVSSPKFMKGVLVDSKETQSRGGQGKNPLNGVKKLGSGSMGTHPPPKLGIQFPQFMWENSISGLPL